MPTSVADTSWQTSTSNRIGLRKLDGFSTSLASVRAPCRLSSTNDLALILLVRTRLVSAMASTPEPASSTAMIDEQDGVLGVEARGGQEGGDPRRRHARLPTR